ncbi:copine family protein 1-like [Mercenaria mercenaria]|uniref:copine family protein 1-like n=1 Tax=Mercenaria mercenaria TaxID=6596 RepID=UPI00234E5536|nr:copine family protein 1-like [Mercenaria mercenaria]
MSAAESGKNPDDGPGYETLAEITKAMKEAGVENCGLIFGIDYTISNKLQGQKTFDGHSLHDITKDKINPYQEVICILGETLEPLDDDGIIHAYGFGDRKTKDKKTFPLKPQGECEGFAEVLDVYNEMTPKIRMGGPTNFAPLIRKAIDIVRKNQEYHILVIVADGQVTSEEETIQAIVDASCYPLSIVVIGVGDGPWNVMNDLDEKLPSRKFDNFQFVDFHEIKATARSPQTAIAIEALSEVPEQYKAIKKLKLLENM